MWLVSNFPSLGKQVNLLITISPWGWRGTSGAFGQNVKDSAGKTVNRQQTGKQQAYLVRY